MDAPEHVGRLRKLLFWLLLGTLSVFFAEVISGSDPTPFIHGWGLMVIVPLYTLHLLVLGGLIFAYGKPRFYALFAAGVLFGLYEAYITKVLWDPFWSDPSIFVGGVALIETVALILFWHPLMAFIVPLIAGEVLFTASRETVEGLPRRLRACFVPRRRGSAVIAVLTALAGIRLSVSLPSPGLALVSGISTFGVIFALGALWRRSGGTAYMMRDLLPNKRELPILTGALIALYAITVPLIRPEALPGIDAQMTVWLLYFIFSAITVLQIRKSRMDGLQNSPVKETADHALRTAALFALLFTLSAFLGGALPALGAVVSIGMWLLWIAGGVLLGILLILDTVKK